MYSADNSRPSTSAASFSAPIRSRRLHKHHDSMQLAPTERMLSCTLTCQLQILTALLRWCLHHSNMFVLSLIKAPLWRTATGRAEGLSSGKSAVQPHTAVAHLRVLSAYSCPARTLYLSTKVQCWQGTPCTGLSRRMNGTESNSCLLICPDHCHAARGTLPGRACTAQPTAQLQDGSVLLP
jgi:hypothetical protein